MGMSSKQLPVLHILHTGVKCQPCAGPAIPEAEPWDGNIQVTLANVKQNSCQSSPLYAEEMRPLTSQRELGQVPKGTVVP